MADQGGGYTMPSIYVEQYLAVGKQFKRALDAVTQAASSQSITQWSPYGMASPQQQVQQGQGPASEPVREAWMRDWEWEKHLRHMREAREAAHKEGS